MKNKSWKEPSVFGPRVTALGLAMAIGLHGMGAMGRRGPLFDIGTDDGAADDDAIGTSIKALRDKMAACNDEIDTLEAAMNKDETDDAGKAAKSEAAKKYKAKTTEFEALESQLQRATAKAARGKSLRNATTLATVTAPGVIAPSGTVQGKAAAQAKTPEEEDVELTTQFLSFCQGKAISDVARSALAPQAKGLQGKGDVRVPGKMLRYLVGSFMQGKALPMTSETATGTQLRFNEYSNQILNFPVEPAIVLPLCSRMTTKTGKAIFPRFKQNGTTPANAQLGGVSFGWVADGAQAPEQEPQFEQLEIDSYEASAYTELSKSLMTRAPGDLEQFLTTLFSAAILDGVDTAILSGSGAGRPTGFLLTPVLKGVDSTGATCISVARTTASVIKFDDVDNVRYLVPPQLRKAGVYVAADDGMKALEQLRDTQGRPIFADSLKDGSPSTLRGKPIYSTLRLTYGALGDLCYIVPGAYMVAMEQEVVIARSEHYKFGQGVVAFRAFTLLGGKPMTPFGFGAVAA